MLLNRHKDLSPEETIIRNKQILKNLGIKPKLRWQHSINKLWAVNLEDCGISWYCNGKGSTKLFAEASGYGEAIERLSNVLGVFDVHNISTEDLHYKDFRFFNDEIKKPTADLFKEAPVIWADAKMQAELAEEQEVFQNEIIDFWSLVLNEPETFSFIPFYDVRNNKQTFLPGELLAYLCGSNGLCEGNTPEEALVQGLSEICERFVEPYIYFNNLTPPEIPRDFLEKEYPEHFQVILDIEKKSKYQLHVFDCSLGKEFPVIGVMLIDPVLQRYYMQFGASPYFAIALERCLTEMYQGVDFNDPQGNTLWMTTYTDSNETLNKTRKNLYGRFTRGVGAVSDSFFKAQPSWTFTKWKTPDTASNQESLIFLKDLLLTYFENIFIRDNSYFGVPSYMIYIPQASSYPRGLGPSDFPKEEAVEFLQYLYERASELTDFDRTQLLKYYASAPHKEVQFDAGDPELYKEIPEKVIIAALFADNKQYADAAQILESLPYYELDYKAMREEFSLKALGVPEPDRDRRITLFYGTSALQKVKKFCRTRNMTAALLEIKGPKCLFDQKRRSKVFRALKDSQKTIDQLNLSVLFT